VEIFLFPPCSCFRILCLPGLSTDPVCPPLSFCHYHLFPWPLLCSCLFGVFGSDWYQWRKAHISSVGSPPLYSCVAPVSFYPYGKGHTAPALESCPRRSDHLGTLIVVFSPPNPFILVSPEEVYTEKGLFGVLSVPACFTADSPPPPPFFSFPPSTPI